MYKVIKKLLKKNYNRQFDGWLYLWICELFLFCALDRNIDCQSNVFVMYWMCVCVSDVSGKSPCDVISWMWYVHNLCDTLSVLLSQYNGIRWQLQLIVISLNSHNPEIITYVLSLICIYIFYRVSFESLDTLAAKLKLDQMNP